jgi:hypothetical protein
MVRNVKTPESMAEICKWSLLQLDYSGGVLCCRLDMRITHFWLSNVPFNPSRPDRAGESPAGMREHEKYGRKERG